VGITSPVGASVEYYLSQVEVRRMPLVFFPIRITFFNHIPVPSHENFRIS